MSWENEFAAMFQEAKNYKVDEQLKIIKAVVIDDSPLILASHAGNITYQAPQLSMTSVFKTELDIFAENKISIIGKQVICVGSNSDDDFIAVSFIAD